MLSRLFLLLILALNSIGPVCAQTALNLPAPGTPVPQSPAYAPALIKGLKIHSDNPHLFDFIVDTGNSAIETDLPAAHLQSQELIKYFLAALTIPEEDLWVNLSPYESNRIIPNELGLTDLGRQMLAQDYILKQFTASLIHPEHKLGKEFWARLYAKAGTVQGSIPMNTFNKIWIVADKANILVRNNTAFIVNAHLKVMLDEDRLAGNKQQSTTPAQTDIIREILLPEIEKEVNEGQNFAPLRQIFYSMVLATWFKHNLKDSLINKVYSNRRMTTGIAHDNLNAVDTIYHQYLQAYKKGVFSLIKDEMDPLSQQVNPRKYFSGGLMDLAMANVIDEDHPEAQNFLKKPTTGNLLDVQANLKSADLAQASKKKKEKKIDWDKPFLPQILSRRGFLARAEAMEFGTRFVDQHWKTTILHMANEKGIIIGPLRTTLNKAMRDYIWNQQFIMVDKNRQRQAGEAILAHNLNTSNEEIIDELLEYIRPNPHIHWPDIISRKSRLLRHKDFLITGGAGQLGQPLAYELIRNNANMVMCFDHNFPDMYSQISDVAKLQSFYTVFRGDLANNEDLERAVAEKDAVIHLGGTSMVTPYNPAEIYVQNTLHTLRLIDAMKKARVPLLIFASSRLVHDVERNAYAASKALAEETIAKYAASKGIRFVILRLPQIAGTFEIKPRELQNLMIADEKLQKEEAEKHKFQTVTITDQRRRLLPLVNLTAVKQRQSREFAQRLLDEAKAEGKTLSRRNAEILSPVEPFIIKGNSSLGFIDLEEAVNAIIRSLIYLFDEGESTTIDFIPAETLTLVEIMAIAQGLLKARGYPLVTERIPGPGPATSTTSNVQDRALEDLQWQPTKNTVTIIKNTMDFFLSQKKDHFEPLKSASPPNAQEEQKRLNTALEGILRIDDPIFRAKNLLVLLAYSVSPSIPAAIRSASAREVKIYEYVTKFFNPRHDLLKRVLTDDDEYDEFMDLLRQYGHEIRKDPIRRSYVREIIKLLEKLHKDPKSYMEKEKKNGHDQDRAMAPGGIDLNANNLSLEMAPGSEEVALNPDFAMIEELKNEYFRGFVPVITQITPLKSVLPLLGLER